MTRKSILSLVAAGLLAAALAAPAADAQRGRGNGGNHGNNSGGNHSNDRDHRRDNDRHDNDHHDNNWGFSFNFGAPYYRSYDYYRPYYRYSPGITVYTAPAYNAWGLRPYECRVDYEFDYWYGRPADVEVRRCADPYGNIYIVDGSRRLWRYR